MCPRQPGVGTGDVAGDDIAGGLNDRENATESHGFQSAHVEVKQGEQTQSQMVWRRRMMTSRRPMKFANRRSRPCQLQEHSVQVLEGVQTFFNLPAKQRQNITI
jgi:hypothetical protein